MLHSTQWKGEDVLPTSSEGNDTISPFAAMWVTVHTVISINIPFPIYHVHGETDVVSITLLLYPCSFVLLPLLLLCQSQITHNLKCRRERERVRVRGREDEDRLETAPTSYWSTAVTSRTQFIVPPESTETDPLIITQDTGTTGE